MSDDHSERPSTALSAIVGPGRVRAERLVDWLGRESAGGWLVRPTDVDQVRDVVSWCASSGTPLVPVGGNTGLVGGTRPDRSAVVLDLTDLTGLRVDAIAGVARAQAGVTLARLQQAASAAGWFYGVDLAARDSATVGGTVATNAGGIRVCAFGSTRAQLLGVQAVLADGELIDDLRALPKDNTGFSLKDLLCGSEGTLAIITEVALRLHHAPGPSVVVAAVVADLTAAVTTSRHLSDQLRLLAAEVVDADAWRAAADDRELRDPLDPATGYVLLVELEVGTQDPADALAALADVIPPGPVAVAIDDADRRNLWQLRELQAEWWVATAGADLHKYDITLPLADLDGPMQALGALLDDATTRWGVFGHIAEGSLHVQAVGRGDPDLDRAVSATVSAAGGSLSAEHGVGRDKAAHLGLRRSPAELHAMRAIKTALDPAGILNPGVLFP